ncbi:hypothetical protein JXR93_07005 [bacterium]|nr:hypothetical protein [bacterium]
MKSISKIIFENINLRLISIFLILLTLSLYAQNSINLEYKIFFSSKEIGKEIISFNEKNTPIDSKISIKDPDTDTIHNLNYSFKENVLKIVQDETDEEQKIDNISPIEPPITLFLYKILSLNKNKIKLFMPSSGNRYDATLENSSVQKVVFRKKELFLNRYILVFDQIGIEIFTDMDGKIVLTNSPNLSIRTEYIGDSINPYSGLKDSKKTLKIVEKTEKIKVGSVEFPIYTFSPKAEKTTTNILLIHDFNDENTHFYRELAIVLGEKCGNIIFPKISIDKLDSFNNKYEVFKKIVKKYKNIHIIAIGEGSIISYKLKKEFKNRVESIVLLNPLYFNYFEILKQQTDSLSLQENRKISLKVALKELDNIVKSDEKYTIFNDKKISTKYFKELFKEEAKNYKDFLNGNIAIFTAKYDSDIDSKNGWYLYSFIEKNRDAKVIYKEIDESNHYFFKIPYKSFAFDFENQGEFNRVFIKELTRFLKKVTKR